MQYLALAGLGLLGAGFGIYVTFHMLAFHLELERERGGGAY